MTMRSPKMVYAQSSDIRSRTYLEYRRDMKKKGIAELEFLPYLEGLLKERRGDDGLKVSKHGGDAVAVRLVSAPLNGRLMLDWRSISP